jgi:hypothetical protein
MSGPRKTFCFDRQDITGNERASQDRQQQNFDHPRLQPETQEEVKCYYCDAYQINVKKKISLTKTGALRAHYPVVEMNCLVA